MRTVRTGEAARLLGVSRQHVVDLCERGELPHVRVGKHRRIAVQDLHQRRTTALTREQEKSLWLHRAVVAALLVDPNTTRETAEDNITRWLASSRSDGRAASYLRQWQELLRGDLDSLIEVLSSPSSLASELRQNSPFAGVLPEDTRRRVLRHFVEHWDREHAGAA